MPNLSQNIQNFAHKNGLFENDQKIVVGVSGGADSVCLLLVLLQLSKKYDFSLHIAHVNYALRGKDSDLDQKFVENLARTHGLEISVLSLKKPASTANLENKLRNQRYAFFEKIRKNLGFGAIAVAHNQDDQAETVLLRIIRGSGLQGMASMKPKNGSVIRPLLATSRKEIIAYLEERNVAFRTDKTNLQPIFTRNKLRLKLIPYLEKNFNPNIKETLAGLADNASWDYDYISAEASKKAKLSVSADGAIRFSAKEIQKLHPALSRQGLRNILGKKHTGLADLESGHLAEIEKIIKSDKNKTQKSRIKGLSITRNGDIVSILFAN